MKRLTCLISIVLTVLSCFGQEANKSSANKTTVWFPNRKDTQRIEARLRVNSRGFITICNYPVNKLVVDSLNVRLDYHVDKEDVSECLVSDSVCIHVKDSYCWNVQNPLPKVKNRDVISLILKGKEKYSEKESQLFNYLQFYHSDDKEWFEKFIYYQNYEVDSKLYQFVYHVTYEDGKRFINLGELVEEEIE